MKSGLQLPGKSSRTVALSWLLTVLLLFAQQGALVHALGHAVGHVHETTEASHVHEQRAHAHEPGHASAAHADYNESDGRNAVSEQCAFDLVYSQVLGGLHAAHLLHFAKAEPVTHAIAAAQLRSAATSVPYDSRGPPAFS